ncbi:MAG: hypothetical protein IKR09_07935 [Alphaproteobacteria bacterium]|nr:hypothetical protein [Alphaproteobacteria bacterium]
MFHSLSRFSLATRIYSGFLVLGLYVVLVCFASVFAVGYVHREYAKANGVIENIRQLSLLENGLFNVNRSLHSFAVKGAEDEKASVEENFQVFEEKAAEIGEALEATDIYQNYRQIMSALTEKYRSNISEVFSLHEKSVEAADKVNSLAEKASTQLNSLIEETTLPSAAFALNGLREQLETVLKSIDAASAENAESQKQLGLDFSALKKAQNVAKQAEMINTKQLKALFLSFNGLEEEINRKLKIDQTLFEKMKGISFSENDSENDFKKLIQLMEQSSTRLLSQAEVKKISLQKIFVFMAALGGALAVFLSFLSLFGIRYPLARLIENAQEMARGEDAVLIHFTERNDEVGSLAKALAVLLVRLKESPFAPGNLLSNKRTPTYGSSMAYVPVTEIEKSNSDGFAYFGQGVGVDTESQLCQILFLIQHVNESAAKMTQEIRQNFSAFREQAEKLRCQEEDMKNRVLSINETAKENNFSDLLAEINKFVDSFSESFSLFDEMRLLFEKQDSSLGMLVSQLERMQVFVPKLTEWGRIVGELTATLHSLSVETKILSLNASIEAAKAGENAKSFGAVSLDMRYKSHKTAKIAEQLITHLASIRDDVIHFTEAMNAVGLQIEEIRRCMQLMQPVRDEQTESVKSSFEQAESVRNVMASYVEKNEKIHAELNALPENVEKSELFFPVLEQKIMQAEQALDEFNASLPTYEEEQENNDA